MKKIITLAALAAICFASCSKNEVSPLETEGNAIQFGIYTPKAPQLKGTETTTATIQVAEKGFGVNAVYYVSGNWADEATAKASNFMKDQQVTYNGTWGYSPVKYWPTAAEAKLSFFAYAPYGDKNIKTNVNDNASVIKYTVPATADLMTDFVAACSINKSGSDTPEKVVFELKHELTKVNFYAKTNAGIWVGNTDKNATKVVITDVELVGGTSAFYKSATYTYNTENPAEKGTWNYGETPDLYAGYPLTESVAYGAVTVGGYSNAAAIALEGETPVNLFGEGESLYLIPLADGLATEGDVKVKFTYSIVTADGKLDKKYSETTATKIVSLPAQTLKQGVAYNFTFTFGIDEVVVEATVADWGKAEEKGENVEWSTGEE